jgi:uncharacterized repeat protein (TIGR03806 family)
VVDRFSLSARKRDENFALRFAGFVDAPKDAVYKFTLASSGWSRLLVDAVEIAAVTGEGKVREASGHIALKAGKHPLALLYAQGEGRPDLSVRWSGPGLDLQAIPDSRFYRDDAERLTAPLISPDGGTFTGPVHVRLTTPTVGASIRYTTDGSEPTVRSPVYRDVFALDRSTKVIARVFRDKTGEASEQVAATFTIRGEKPYGLARREVAVTLNVPRDPKLLPHLLSKTGVFRSVAELTPNPGVIPYDVNSPLWSDGAFKRRWIVLPGEARIGFAPTGEWKFPVGTVFVKHFELGTDDARPEKRHRLETRVLVVGEAGEGYGVTYHWKADQSDAELLPGGATEEVEVQTAEERRRRKWVYPSRNDCLVCHTTNAGFVLGVKTRQINGSFTYPGEVIDNQLRTWNHVGLFEPALKEMEIGKFDRLVAVTDKTASLEHRVRSYLDANCAQCHRPGGARGLFDARFDTPLGRQDLVKGAVAAADLGVRDAALITPGHPDKSVVYLRMKRRAEGFAMPPLASQIPDSDALAACAAWIKELAGEKKSKTD